jgi:hypothetical protein
MNHEQSFAIGITAVPSRQHAQNLNRVRVSVSRMFPDGLRVGLAVKTFFFHKRLDLVAGPVTKKRGKKAECVRQLRNL